MSATASAIMTALVNVAAGRGERTPIVLKPGDMAPDFDLQGSDGHRYRLLDCLDRETVVLAWFPKAFTGGCTRECRSLGASRTALGAFKVRYFGVSVDSPETNRQFAEMMGIDYPILSDRDKTVARAYGVLGPSGFASRWTFFIGPDGRILDIDKHVQVTSHGADVAVRLTALGTPRL
jgi:peroxiredoxin Q/BCP